MSGRHPSYTTGHHITAGVGHVNAPAVSSAQPAQSHQASAAGPTRAPANRQAWRPRAQESTPLQSWRLTARGRSDTPMEDAVPDDDKPKPDPDGKPKPDPDAKPKDDAGDDDLGDTGKRALQREREQRKALERQVAELSEQAKELQAIKDKDKSESQREKEAREKAERERDEHAAKLLRMEVAQDKNLPAGAWKRLSGETRAELEDDADELAKLLGPGGKRKTNANHGDGDGGGGPNESMDDLIRRRAGRG